MFFFLPFTMKKVKKKGNLILRRRREIVKEKEKEKKVIWKQKLEKFVFVNLIADQTC